MSVKFILLISSLACLNVQTSSSTSDLPSHVKQVGQYYIFDIHRTFGEALMDCHLRAMILIGWKDLDENPQLWGALNSVQSKGANPEQFWVATKQLEFRDLFRSITNSVIKCFKFSLKESPTFEMSKPLNCMEKSRFVCKKPGSTSRSLIGGITANIHSAVSKSKRVVRWFKEKLKKIGEFTAGELTEIGEIVIDTFKQTGSNIGSGVKGVTLWTKENMEALATKIAEDLRWSKDKAKDALNKVLEVIDEETDELLKD